MAILKIDNREFNIKVKGIRQTFEKLTTGNTGRLMDGSMFIDLIGTFYNYELIISREHGLNADFDELWMILSEPKSFYTVELPHNQEMLTFEAYITQGQRELLRQEGTKNIWGEIAINFLAKSPERKPV